MTALHISFANTGDKEVCLLRSTQKMLAVIHTCVDVLSECS